LPTRTTGVLLADLCEELEDGSGAARAKCEAGLACRDCTRPRVRQERQRRKCPSCHEANRPAVWQGDDIWHNPVCGCDSAAGMQHDSSDPADANARRANGGNLSLDAFAMGIDNWLH